MISNWGSDIVEKVVDPQEGVYFRCLPKLTMTALIVHFNISAWTVMWNFVVTLGIMSVICLLKLIRDYHIAPRATRSHVPRTPVIIIKQVKEHMAAVEGSPLTVSEHCQSVFKRCFWLPFGFSASWKSTESRFSFSDISLCTHISEPDYLNWQTIDWQTKRDIKTPRGTRTWVKQSYTFISAACEMLCNHFPLLPCLPWQWIKRSHVHKNINLKEDHQTTITIKFDSNAFFAFQCITKACLYNIDPLKPHFYIVKLGFTGVYVIFLISAQKQRLCVLVRTASQRRF